MVDLRLIQYSASSQNTTPHNYLLVVTRGRGMALVISESEFKKKHAFIMHSTYFRRFLYAGFLLSLGSGMGARQPQPHCKSQTCFPFSSNSPNVTKLRLFRLWHRRLSAFLTFLTFLFSLWFLGRLAQLLHRKCHHALSKESQNSGLCSCNIYHAAQILVAS